MSECVEQDSVVVIAVVRVQGVVRAALESETAYILLYGVFNKLLRLKATIVDTKWTHCSWWVQKLTEVSICVLAVTHANLGGGEREREREEGMGEREGKDERGREEERGREGEREGGREEERENGSEGETLPQKPTA
jgi:hypothetical protein